VQFQNAILEREVVDIRAQAKKIKKNQIVPINDGKNSKYGAES